MTMGHEWAHAQLLGQDQGPLVVDFGRRAIEGVGVGVDDAKLVQRQCLIAAILRLPGQIERLARVLQGLCTMSLQATTLTEP